MDMPKLKYQRYYSIWHKDTPQHYEMMRKLNHYLFGRFIKDIPRGNTLDIGCGMGFTMKYLQSVGFNSVYGYDIDEGQITISKKHNLNVFQSDNIDDVLSKIKSKFNLITAFDVLEHMPKEQALIIVRKIYQELVPGGMFICTVPNANSALSNRWLYNDFTHHASYAEQSLDFLLYNAGFENIQILSTDKEPLPRPSWLGSSYQDWVGWFNFRLARSFRRWQMVAELGEVGKNIPLSLNLLGVAIK